jgi:hypothetical protein
MSISNDILALAAKQGGYISRDQLIQMNLSVSAIDRRVRSGDLSVVAHGTYQVFSSDDYVDLLRGAVLTLPNAVVSHQAAAHLLEFPRRPALAPTVTVASHTTHEFPGVTVRRCSDLETSHLTKVQRLQVTNVMRTAFDLAGVLKYPEFESIAESLILDGRLEMRHLQRMEAELTRRGKPGSRSVHEFIATRDGFDPKATPLETRGRGVLKAAGLPPPIPQFPIPWDPDRRFDDAFPPPRLAIEWDSRSWHEQRAAMQSDRERDREAAMHKWFVARFTWEEVTKTPEKVAATVAYLLRERSSAA